MASDAGLLFFCDLGTYASLSFNLDGGPGQNSELQLGQRRGIGDCLRTSAPCFAAVTSNSFLHSWNATTGEPARSRNPEQLRDGTGLAND